MKSGYFKNRSLKITVALLLCFLMSFGTIMPMAQLSYAAGDEDKRVEKQAEPGEKTEKSDDQKKDDDRTEEEKAESADGSSKEDSDLKEEPAEQSKEKVEEKENLRKGSLLAAGQVDGIVTTTLEHGILHSNGHDIVNPVTVSNGGEITVTQAEKLIKLTINVNKVADGNVITHKDVSITIPRGLQLVKATGVASVNKGNTNGSYNKGEYTPTEQMYLTDYSGNTIKYPQWQAQHWLYGNTLDNNFDTVNTSGVLTYSISDAVSSGTVEVYLRANPYFAQPASHVGSVETQINDIKVEVKGEDQDGNEVTDSNSFGVKFKSDGSWYHKFGIDSKNEFYPGPTVDYSMQLDPTVGNAFGNNVNTNIAVTNLRVDVTYPKGAVFSPPSGWTKASETDNGNSITVHLTRNATSSWNMSSKQTVGSFKVQYPAELFPAGSRPKVEISNMEYDALRYDVENDQWYVDHRADRAGDTSKTVTIVKIPDTSNYSVWWNSARGDTEEANDYTTDRKLLTSVKRNISSKLPNNAIRLRCDVDIANNNVSQIVFQSPVVSKQVYPTAKGAKITKVVVKYEGEDEERVIYDNPNGWTSDYPVNGNYGFAGSGNIPIQSGNGTAHNEWGGYSIGGSSYYYVGHNRNSIVRLTAPAGKTYEYAYIEYDSDNAYQNQYRMQTYGRPKSDEYTGRYSRDSFSSYYQNDDGEWVCASKWQSTGFRWKKPDPPKLTYTTGYKGSSVYQYNHTECGFNYPELGYVKFQNTTASKLESSLKIAIDIDTKDAVRKIDIPYSYNSNANTASQRIKSIKYTLQGDPTVYTWEKDSGEPAPFTNGTNEATITAPGGGLFESFEVVLDGWSTTENASYLRLFGYLTNREPDGVRSEHEVTVTRLADAYDPEDEDEEVWSGKTGKTFTKPTSMSVDPVTVNTMAIAGTSKRVDFTVRGAGYTGSTFAIVLPEGLTLENMYVDGLTNWLDHTGNFSKQSIGRDSDGSTMTKISERDATPEEVERIFGTDHPEITAATVYYYDMFDQGTYLRDDHYHVEGSGTYSFNMAYKVHAVIHTKATYGTAEYSFDKLIYLGTNLDGATLSRRTGGGPVYGTDDTHKSVDNFLGLGESANIITGHSGSYLRIEKSPALIVEERIKDSESEYMYYDGDEKNIARFGPGEEGKIQIKITNTVDIGAWESVNNYIFIPLPKKDQQILSTEQKVDMKYTGPLTLTGGDYDEATYEVKYISNASYSTIDVANAEQVYSNGADTVSDDTNLIAVKVTGLKPTGDMVFEVPIKAPNHVQQDEIFNQMGSVSIYVFSGDGTDNSYATYRCTEKENPLRLSYRYPEWKLTFQNVRDNGDGTVTDLSNPVIGWITRVRDQDPVLKHGTAGDYPTYQSLPEDPTLASHNFEGYYLDKAFTEPFVPFDGTNIDEATRITKDTTIYVKWVEVPCELTVSKFIANLDGDGAYANLNDEFTLTINLRAADGSASRYTTFEYTGYAMAGVDKPADGTLTLDSDGNATINIKHGQSIKIKGILRDQLVTVTETEKNNYKKPTVSITGKQDATAYTTGSFALEEGETTVKFSNNYTSVTPTGVGSASMVFIYIITGLIMIAAALYLIRRKFI